MEYPSVRLGLVRAHVPLGRQLESWFGLGKIHGLIRPTGEGVRVMVWLVLESLSKQLFPRCHHM